MNLARDPKPGRLTELVVRRRLESKVFLMFSMTPAHDPKPGWAYRMGWPQTRVGLPNGLRRRKSGAPKFHFSDFLQNHRKTKFSKRVFEESFCRKCTWRAYATVHRRISHYLSRGRVSFLESPVFLLILCADFELGAECLPWAGLGLPGSGLKGRLVSLGFDLVL